MRVYSVNKHLIKTPLMRRCKHFLVNGPNHELQSWTKVLEQICTCDAFSHAPNSHAWIQLYLLSPFPHSIYNVGHFSRVSTLEWGGVGEGGEGKQILKRITVLFQTPFLKHSQFMQWHKCPKQFCSPLHKHNRHVQGKMAFTTPAQCKLVWPNTHQHVELVNTKCRILLGVSKKYI